MPEKVQKNLICVTLGTGVGGGIIANGEIVRGVNGAGGEIGHITSVPKDGSPCNCGKKGMLRNNSISNRNCSPSVREK
ncbi:hypothetical protein GCM10020331_009800 [Ectobacillus funiculus]